MVRVASAASIQPVMELHAPDSTVARTRTDARVRPVRKMQQMKTSGVGQTRDLGNGKNLVANPWLL